MFTTQCLAELPPPGSYVNLYKLGVVLALFIGWVYVCQWVDRDTDFVKTKRERWNLIVLGTGIAGMAILFLIPWSGTTYFMGLAFWLLLAGGGQMSYIIHRNGRVVSDQRVLTLGHVKSIISRDESSKTRKLDRGQRVHLSDHEGSNVARPTERDESEQHDATQEFLFDVLWRRSSDVDLVVSNGRARLVYRIDGVALEQKGRIVVEDAERVIAYLKGLAGLNPDERRRPQSGRIQAGLLVTGGDLPLIEVLSSGSTAGERLRLQIRMPEACKRLNEVGFPPRELEKVKSLIKRPTGLVIVAGAKQSGVTTTQYALLRDHDAFLQNLHTLESAPLLELDNITQNRHEGSGGEVSFARQLQSVLRREPDVVLVGQCSDHETAQIVCRAATADRKIYLAMEAKDAFDAIDQLRKMVDDDAMFAKALLGATNQRLVRVLCTACRQAFKPDERLLKKLNLPVGKIEHFHRPPTEAILDKKGNEIVCQTCQGTGYVGRTAVFEIMVADEGVAKLLADGAPIRSIRDHCRRGRMHDLRRASLQKVYDGVTSLDEILRALRFDGK
ncbi:MAG: Flp pilus assembly complex ATPase component TadA [Planctomycetes bacterium]|nr:Flp pilus assembly complex ATPase component TadA [Planctomycetota bacterium]